MLMLLIIKAVVVISMLYRAKSLGISMEIITRRSVTSTADLIIKLSVIIILTTVKISPVIMKRMGIYKIKPLIVTGQ